MNIDIEGLTSNASLVTKLTQTLATRLRADNPGAQVSFDLDIYADSWTKDGYNATELAGICDFLVLMGYDIGWASSPATPNAPLPNVIAGIASYAAVGVAPWSIVLGVPWYGYDFPCNAHYPAAWSPGAGPAPCRTTTFSGNWWSSFATISTELVPRSLAGPRLDVPTASMWIDYIAKGNVWHQVWYDDVNSLSTKYSLISGGGLRGVAMWTADYAGNGTDPDIGAPMWAAIRSCALAACSATATASASPTATASRTSSHSHTSSRTQSATARATRSATATATTTRSASRTHTPSRSPPVTRTQSRSGTHSPSSSRTSSGTAKPK